MTDGTIQTIRPSNPHPTARLDQSGLFTVMAAYYNELDPFAARWLRNLIAAGHIAPGDVDERSIEDVHPNDLRGYTQCHFFAGIGVWSYALRRAGWPDDRPVWTGSCPCQPFSQAGEGAGFDDERHLWPAFFHLIEKCRPPIILGEQVASKDANAWIDLVQDDMEGLGYPFAAIPFPACSVGAPHIRQRTYWCASNSNRSRLERIDGDGKPESQTGSSSWSELARVHAKGAWATWLSQSGTAAIIDGAPGRVGRTRAYGNAIVAPQAQVFIRSVMECMPSPKPAPQRAVSISGATN
ncbi:MAG: DNA cytosine methyltransferase [Ottowia sp.]|uniref:DNA cytosine methyltransferase n=1 Tax=Ottowia sp. TaxID=1898956 RepID=UPI003C763086